MKPGILLVEDEPSIAKAMKAALEFEAYSVFLAGTISEAMLCLEKNISNVHIVLLDVMLPDGEGFDAFVSIKKKHPHLRILFVTARMDSADRVKGLKLGADDYITKPFDLDELLIRLQRIEQQMEWKKRPEVFEFQNGKMDFRSCLVWDRQGKKYELSLKENEVLRFLIMNTGRAVSREEIYQHCWKGHEGSSLRTIDNFIVSFRKIFEENPSKPVFFRSVRGIGYMFDLQD